ncbi:MAG TPA: formyltransferase family protein [Burkholderiaceae bacterium]|nr:formyltransferase family protein [Burkholderiaceae bacterium]
MNDVTVLCTDPAHPVNPWLERWARRHAGGARVAIRRDVADARGGDFLFLVSCHQLVRADVRARYRHVLVLHASPLPRGRGMSPHVWQIVEGADRLVLSLLDAADAVDAGDIWRQAELPLAGTELHDEIHARLFRAECALMTWALRHCDATRPRPQHGEPTHYRRRTPEDSRVDPARPLAEAFDLLRIADPERYPAFFEWRGAKYRLRIERME